MNLEGISVQGSYLVTNVAIMKSNMFCSFGRVVYDEYVI